MCKWVVNIVWHLWEVLYFELVGVYIDVNGKNWATALLLTKKG